MRSWSGARTSWRQRLRLRHLGRAGGGRSRRGVRQARRARRGRAHRVEGVLEVGRASLTRATRRQSHSTSPLWGRSARSAGRDSPLRCRMKLSGRRMLAPLAGDESTEHRDLESPPPARFARRPPPQAGEVLWRVQYVTSILASSRLRQRQRVARVRRRGIRPPAGQAPCARYWCRAPSRPSCRRRGGGPCPRGPCRSPTR